MTTPRSPLGPLPHIEHLLLVAHELRDDPAALERLVEILRLPEGVEPRGRDVAQKRSSNPLDAGGW